MRAISATALTTLSLLFMASHRTPGVQGQPKKPEEYEDDPVICPELKCNDDEGKDKMDAITVTTCYLMQKEDVTQTIYARECYDATRANKKEEITYCSFNGQNGEYAWLDEDSHYMEWQRSAVGKDVITDEKKQLSQFKYKKLSGECKKIIGVRKNLLPGRFCTDSYQCRSSYCKEMTCRGRGKDDSCSSHEDCGNGMYCRMNENWPFETRCSKLKTSFDNCNEDIECQNSQFCWYPSQAFRESIDTEYGSKVCLDMYSLDAGETFGWYHNDTYPWEEEDEVKPGEPPKEKKYGKPPTYDDYVQNGKYCASGLAYPVSKTQARCTTFKEMRFDSEVLESPYKCDPTIRKKKCELYFEIDEEDAADPDPFVKDFPLFTNNDCKCALGPDKKLGYCSSIIGSELYEKAVGAKMHMMSSSSCHTMDRYNMRAQKDRKCGIGSFSNDFRFAIDKMFNVTYWPYIQDEETFQCIRRFFSDSYDSLILEEARPIKLAGVLSLVALGLFSLF